jgi:hypothetical protein
MPRTSERAGPGQVEQVGRKVAPRPPEVKSVTSRSQQLKGKRRIPTWSGLTPDEAED